MAVKNVPVAMTIAESDSGGGAGIQADLKTFAALGVYGTSVLTAITAQNIQGVADVLELPTSLVESQFDAVVSDIGVDAVKTGLLSTSAIIDAVAGKIRELGPHTLVVDPVIFAPGGDPVHDDAIEALKTSLVPLAQVVTPGAPEAAALVGHEVETLDDAREAAREIVPMGAAAAVVTGGHLEGPSTDILFDGSEFRAFTAPRVPTAGTRGMGCTFASAIAAGLAHGMSLRDAVSGAKTYVTGAVRHAFPVGHGYGPLKHFYGLSEQSPPRG